MEKIWMVSQESNVDGEIMFHVVPCASKETAQRVFENSKKEIMSEGHFSKLSDDDIKEYCFINEGENRFFINDETDDYYEDLYMYEEDVQF